MSTGGTSLRAMAPKLVAAEIGRRLAGGVITAGRWLGRPLEPVADRLAIAPPDIRTADPTVAAEIHAGRFVLGGRVVECGPGSPFDVEPPSPDWLRAMHGFGWLRHLRAAEDPAADADARALVGEWIAKASRQPPLAWEPDVAARRLLSFLYHAPMLLAECEPEFYRDVLAAVTNHVRRLRHRYDEFPPGLGRLRVAIALVAAAVVVPSFAPLVPAATRRLDDELVRQIHPDGGHVSRNPAAILEILVDLLPVRQAQAARGIPVSRTVMNAIDRMMHLLRFFRHGDGTLALFNGAGCVPLSLIATVLFYDDAQGRPPGNAPHAGYQRLEAERTVAIMDTGAAPPPAHSAEAHAGCLSFELSSGRNRLIVNCGAPVRASDPWRPLVRTTAAHSTLVVDDHSSAEVATGLAARLLGPILVGGPREVMVDRQEFEGAVAVIASHDGYLRDFGLRHERTLRLAPAGDRLDGRDRMIPDGAGAIGRAPFAIRFHLHPTVKPTVIAPNLAMLIAPDGEAWEFHAEGAAIQLDDSVLVADPQGARRTLQMVLSGEGPAEIRWTFLRAAEPHGARKRP